MEHPIDRAERVYLEAVNRHRLLLGIVNGLTAGLVLTMLGIAAAVWVRDGVLVVNLTIFLIILLTITGLVLLEVPDARRRYLDAARVWAARMALDAAEGLSELRATETSWAELSDLLEELREMARGHPQVARFLEWVEPAVREYRRGRLARSKFVELLREQGERLLVARELIQPNERKYKDPPK